MPPPNFLRQRRSIVRRDVQCCGRPQLPGAPGISASRRIAMVCSSVWPFFIIIPGKTTRATRSTGSHVSYARLNTSPRQSGECIQQPAAAEKDGIEHGIGQSRLPIALRATGATNSCRCWNQSTWNGRARQSREAAVMQLPSAPGRRACVLDRTAPPSSMCTLSFGTAAVRHAATVRRSSPLGNYATHLPVHHMLRHATGYLPSRRQGMEMPNHPNLARPPIIMHTLYAVI